MGDGFWYCDTCGIGQVGLVGQHDQVCFNIKSAEHKNMTGQMCQVGQFGQDVHGRFDSERGFSDIDTCAWQWAG